MVGTRILDLNVGKEVDHHQEDLRQEMDLKEGLHHPAQEDQVAHLQAQDALHSTSLTINLVGVIETVKRCVHHHLNSIVESQLHPQEASHPHHVN